MFEQVVLRNHQFCSTVPRAYGENEHMFLVRQYISVAAHSAKKLLQNIELVSTRNGFIRPKLSR